MLAGRGGGGLPQPHRIRPFELAKRGTATLREIARGRRWIPVDHTVNEHPARRVVGCPAVVPGHLRPRGKPDPRDSDAPSGLGPGLDDLVPQVPKAVGHLGEQAGGSRRIEPRSRREREESKEPGHAAQSDNQRAIRAETVGPRAAPIRRRRRHFTCPAWTADSQPPVPVVPVAVVVVVVVPLLLVPPVPPVPPAPLVLPPLPAEHVKVDTCHVPFTHLTTG